MIMNSVRTLDSMQKNFKGILYDFAKAWLIVLSLGKEF